MNKQTCYQFLNDLEQIIIKYHGRDGTSGFHYDSFQIDQWDVGLPKDIYEKIDIDDFVIRVIWTDNSMMCDDYYITFDELFDWYNNQENKNGSE